jgi:hypothetical protein
MITVCKITSAVPNFVGKKFTLDYHGNLEKQTFGSVVQGKMKRIELDAPRAFIDLLVNLRPSECLAYGLPPHDASLVTTARWQSLGQPHDPLARTLEVFSFPTGGAVLMLDYDAPKSGNPLTRERLIEVVHRLAPKLVNATLVWWPSSSSLIYQGSKEVTGIRGQRLYLFIKHGTDIARLAKTIPDRLWLLGYGHIEVSASGSLLERTVFDASVWQSNRFDFAAGATCGEGLEQRRGPPTVIGSLDRVDWLVDTKDAIPDLTPEELETVAKLKLNAKAHAQNDANQARAVWINQREADITARYPSLSREVVRSSARTAVERSELGSNWEIIVQDESGNESRVTVGEILENHKLYAGRLTKDPLEPEYDGGRWVGKLFLDSASPNLFSFAHGGVNFKLRKQLSLVEQVQGKTHDATNACLNVLRHASDLYDFGDDLALVGPGGFFTLVDENLLRYEVGGRVQFFMKKRQRDGSVRDVLIDPPDKVMKNVLALRRRRSLRPLSGVITAPTLRLDGTVLQDRGYDPRTKLLLECPTQIRKVDEHPTLDHAKRAIDALWLPFHEFPFCSSLDRAVHLAAILTASVRAVLPSAPAFAYDAPIQGSGKTLLARCVGVLANGSDPSVYPHISGRDDDEVRKRIFSSLKANAKAMIWDNVVGQFDSVSMAALLTSPTFTDRILGQSQSLTLPNSMMVLLTGNNLAFQGEMPRRVLISRIDPATDRPFGRSFEVVPYDYCLKLRGEMINAALTLIRAALTHQVESPYEGRLASFERWDAWVRHAVVFANELTPNFFGDPMDAIKINQATDPEQEALSSFLSSFEAVFGDRPISVPELCKQIDFCSQESKEFALKSALEELTGQRYRDLNPKTIGKFLGYRKERIADGRKLIKGPKINDRQTWRVERA